MTGTPEESICRGLAAFEPRGGPIVTPEEIDVYVENFERTGLGGGMNWYCNIDRSRSKHRRSERRSSSCPA